jgi:hypothetical protein
MARILSLKTATQIDMSDILTEDRLVKGWDDPSVPKRDWEWVETRDEGRGNYIECEMCGYEEVRYVHVMSHPEFTKLVEVGCICAAHMTGESVDLFREREKPLRSKAQAWERWQKRHWKRSAKGNATICVDDDYMTVFKNRYGSGWKTVIGEEFQPKIYPTEEAAKLSLFEEYWKRKTTRSPAVESNCDKYRELPFYCPFTPNQFLAASHKDRDRMINDIRSELVDLIQDELPHYSRHNSWEVEIEDWKLQEGGILFLDFSAGSYHDGDGYSMPSKTGTLALHPGKQFRYEIYDEDVLDPADEHDPPEEEDVINPATGIEL